VKRKTKAVKKDPYASINTRLDAILRLQLETMNDKKKKFNDATAVRTLNSAGLTPTEIAKILGKKGGSSAVSAYLYSKSKKKKSKQDEDNSS